MLAHISTFLVIAALLGLPRISVGQGCGSGGPKGDAACPPSAMQRNGEAVLSGLPMLFEPNRGQRQAGVGFISHAERYQLELAADGVTFTLREGPQHRARVRMMLEGVSPQARMVGLDEVSAKTNYLFGRDASRWITQVPNFTHVKVERARPGVDLSYYGSGRQLEYDLDLAPGADPRQLTLRFSGAQHIKLGADGALDLGTRAGTLELHRPIAYQYRHAAKVPVKVAYLLAKDGRVRFRIGNYDRSRTLIIDPVVTYVSYFSGAYHSPDYSQDTVVIMGMATDNAGYSYIYGYDPGQRVSAGATTTGSCPTEGCINVFVMKVNPNAYGAAGLVFTTLIPVEAAEDLTLAAVLGNYFGSYGAYGIYGAIVGDGGNQAFYPSYALALDPAGNIYITGAADNPDYPTTANSYAPTCNMNPNDPEAAFCVPAVYVSKLSPDGSTMLYSTFINATPPNPDPPAISSVPADGLLVYPAFGYAIVADSAQIAYVAAATSVGFPVTNGLPCTTTAGGNPSCQYASILKLDTTKSGSTGLVYSEGFDIGTRVSDYGGPPNFIATDGAGGLYSAQSVCYPLQSGIGLTPVPLNGYDTASPATATPCFGMFKLNPTGSVAYATYFDPFISNNGQTLVLGGVAADISGRAYLAGVISPASSLPIGGNGNLFTVPDAATSGDAAQFVLAFDTTQTGVGSLVYSSGIEGIQPQTRTQIAGNGCGSIAISGEIDSTSFPFVNPITGAVESTGSTVTPPFAAIINTKLSGQAGLTFSSSMFANSNYQVSVATLSFNLQGGLAISGYLQNDTIQSDYATFATANAFQSSPSIPPVALETTNPEPYFQAIEGAIAPGCINLAPTSLAFGSEAVGSTTSTQVVTVTNTSEVNLNFTSIVASSGFTATSGCGSSIAPNASCTVSAAFSPTSAGSQNGTLTFTDSDVTSPQVVALSGTGTGGTSAAPAVVLSPTTLSFANTAVGQTAAPQSISVTNTGNASTNLAVSVAGANPADFAQSNTCGTVLAAGASCAITASFTPSSAAAFNALIQVADSAANSPQTVNLSGAGVAAAAPQVTVSPATLSFPATNVGATSASQIVTLSNTGTATLSITGVTVAGSGSADFAETDACTSTLAAGANCTLSVTFTPTAAGSAAATLEIADKAATSPQSVALTGTGNSVTANYTVSSPTPPQIVQVGGSAEFAVVVTPANGAFSNAVSFSATGLPPGATANFAPSSVTPGASPATTTMTVATAAATADLGSPNHKPPVYLAWALLVPLSLRACARGRRRPGSPPRTRLVRWCALAIAIAGTVAGCDGGFRLPAAAASTATYVITVSATSGSDVQSTSVTLTVQQ